MSEPQRPVLRYHGGKWRLAPWIIEHFPAHRTYVEAFGGAGSVLLRKQPSVVEVYNDLHQRVTGVFRVLRNPVHAARLAQLLALTPCASVEYALARELHPDPVEDARRMLVLGHQSHGSTGTGGGKLSGWRRGVRPNSAPSSQDWASLPDHVWSWCERLRSVYIECADALDVIRMWDREDTLFYIDPPYVAGTRTASSLGAYLHEMDDAQHRSLAATLHAVKGMVVLSGYDSPLYAELYGSWQRVSREVFGDRQAARVETLWISPNAMRADLLVSAA